MLVYDKNKKRVGMSKSKTYICNHYYSGAKEHRAYYRGALVTAKISRHAHQGTKTIMDDYYFKFLLFRAWRATQIAFMKR